LLRKQARERAQGFLSVVGWQRLPTIRERVAGWTYSVRGGLVHP
jgi:hypothetical protein